jgi:cation diffusion facilitator CzcD-associated flavoprotein CzcO
MPVTTIMMTKVTHRTDAITIGAGPCGLFALYP